MVDEQSQEKHCALSLMLSRFSARSSYHAKAGLERCFVLLGRVHDPHDAPGFGSAFHDKLVRVEIHSPPDAAILDEIRTKYVGGVEHLCGWVIVRAGIEPERFELNREWEGKGREMVEAEPIRAFLYLTPDAFEAIRRQAAEAYDHCRMLGARIPLVGDALPTTGGPCVFLLQPKELDISTEKVYGVRQVEIFDTRYFDRLRGRVLEIDREDGKGRPLCIQILLTEARYGVDVQRAYIHSFSCEGRVINGSGRPYDGANVTVEFREHQPDRHGELPEKAVFGEFSYYLREPDEKYSSTHFAFSLLHVPGDDRDLLIPLLSQEAGTHVVLTVNLATKEEELLAVTNELQGDVRYYSFEVRRNLIKA